MTTLPVVLVVIPAGTHGMRQDVVSDGTPNRIPLHAGIAVVDTAEDARVGNLRGSGGEAREGSGVSLREGDLGANGEWSIVPERRLEDKGGSTADRRMAGGVFRMCWSSGGKRVQPGRPVGVHRRSIVVVGISAADGGNGAPENETVFGIPSSDGRVRHGQIHLRKQVRVFGET